MLMSRLPVTKRNRAADVRYVMIEFPGQGEGCLIARRSHKSYENMRGSLVKPERVQMSM